VPIKIRKYLAAAVTFINPDAMFQK